MALNPGCVGTTYPPARPYPVEAETIRRFAEAVGDPAPVYTDLRAAKDLGHPAVPAPPTFPFVVAMRAMDEVFSYEDIGFDPTYLIHGEQRFEYTRPVRAGDRLVTTVGITGAKRLRGKDVLSLRADVADEDGEPVVALHMTFVSLSAVEGGGSA
ncbi:FAS1-like dehydratase domain-containing protein [Streptomyces profundus]|uniref:FAS1-like dehydratase domain-containing protein n=1 Tax=Streptomyces profundus TaxID=2867410 RepID=UPI001D16B13C|nr:MaoC family dehydratase N-terminal domain-containing protein [Streptomyces sp. MA3_2.13]UED86262.1 MaoC family dehydratase N-terminal domain-containing protein [Streptomyces sp. MA3_2.13]